MLKAQIKGKEISSMKEIHDLLSKEFSFGKYYGGNLNALWDVLTTDIERPFEIVILDFEELQIKLGEHFEDFHQILMNVVKYDEDMGFKDKFVYKW